MFRVFDALNWIQGMIESPARRSQDGEAIVEAAVCYSGDITDGKPPQVHARLLRQAGQGAGGDGRPHPGDQGHGRPAQALCRRRLVKALQAGDRNPIHLHTHDTSSNGGATLLIAAQAGVDVVDAAPLLGLRPHRAAQPERPAGGPAGAASGIRSSTRPALQQLANYWETVRTYYAPFESELRSGTAEVYHHEIPGGQYFQLQAAGGRAGPRTSLGGVQGDVPQGQRHVRRRHQGDAELQDRAATWRCSWSRTTCNRRMSTHAGMDIPFPEGHRLLQGDDRPARRRFPQGSAEDHPQRTAVDLPAGRTAGAGRFRGEEGGGGEEARTTISER